MELGSEVFCVNGAVMEAEVEIENWNFIFSCHGNSRTLLEQWQFINYTRITSKYRSDKLK